MMRFTSASGCPIVLLAAVLVAGCGGGGGGGNEDAEEDTVADPSTEATADGAEDPAEDPADDVTAEPVDEPVDEPVEDPTDDSSDIVEESACLPEATATGDDGHRAGQDCLSCHASMGGSLQWTIAGTLYDDASGSAPVGGATIIATEAGGTEHLLVTHPNGNFYTNAAVTFPVTVAASKCPDHAEMSSTVSNGSCNSCHNSTFRVHLP
ncbi:MAG: hypothetical protein JRG91_00845 [Deltaproteobacteria bacterium]|nr:hypothetical protein [Deltaproteobacteria bacterium]